MLLSVLSKNGNYVSLVDRWSVKEEDGEDYSLELLRDDIYGFWDRHHRADNEKARKANANAATRSGGRGGGRGGSGGRGSGFDQKGKSPDDFRFGPCPNCLKGKGKKFDHDEAHCWDLHPELRPQNVNVNVNANANSASAGGASGSNTSKAERRRIPMVEESDDSDDEQFE